MKKWTLVLGLLAATFTLSVGTASAAQDSRILLNYSDTGLSSSKVIVEGTTMVPLKSLAAAMGYTLSWDQASKTAKLISPEREIGFITGSKSLKVNGAASALAKPPRIIKGGMYIPLVSGVVALGGKIVYDKGSSTLNIVDEPRYVTASAQGRTYWVSQKNGDLYYRASVTGKPQRMGSLPLKPSAYSYGLVITDAGKGTDLLLLSEKHYAMFNDFSNGYQTLVHSGTILKQMDYHFSNSSYQQAPRLTTTQLYMTDGLNVQYINGDGSLGKLYELEKITGLTDDCTVEYAAADVVLIRSLTNAHLYAINTKTGVGTNLSEKLISSEDWKEWKTADGTDPYVLPKMLVLTKRAGDVLTFTYTPLPEGKAKTVTYNLASQ